MPQRDMTVPESLRETAADLADRILGLSAKTGRHLVAIAGPPGAGKSTLAQHVVDALNAKNRVTALMPMDGFHLDNRILERRGLLPRKGAPETFDFSGFAAMLSRIGGTDPVILPVFDRDRDIAIAGAVEITAETEIVVAEGNYLCFDEDPWKNLPEYWDFSVFLDVSAKVLEERLIARWLDHGLEPDAARTRALSNDIPNARRVVNQVGPVDLRLREPDGP